MTLTPPPRAPRDLILEDYYLEVDDDVEVTLLTTTGGTHGHGPTLVEGRIANATTTVLILDQPAGRITRIPWAAIATIRDRVRPHPAHQ